MKFSRLFLTIGLLLTATPVSAATVDYTGNFTNMGELSVGQSGTIYGGESFGDFIMGLITGSLPENSMVTFSFDTPGSLVSGSLTTQAGYSYTDAGTSYTGLTISTEPDGMDNSVGYENGSPSTALAIASAQVNDPHSVTVIIKNFSAGALTYANSFFAQIAGSKDFTVAYNVSAVPVPAALPLFGLGLGALAAMKSRSRRKRNVAVAA